MMMMMMKLPWSQRTDGHAHDGSLVPTILFQGRIVENRKICNLEKN